MAFQIRTQKFAFLFFLTIANSVLAQNRIKNIDHFFSTLSKNQMINGNVLIAENGKIVFEKSYGYADFPGRKLNTQETTFPIASVTKTFTATAILQLYEKGTLKLIDPVEKYLPEFPYPSITIRHLLSHTSGLQPYDNFFDSLSTAQPWRVFTNKDILPQYGRLRLPLVYAPGAYGNYDNINYIFLAIIIENVSGMSFQDYVKRYILKPAGMTKTIFPEFTFYHYDSAERKNLANLYWYPHVYSDRFVKADTVSFISQYWHRYNFKGFGEIITTLRDLLKYDQALYNGTLLSEATLQKAYAPVRLNNGADNPVGYGLGWKIEKNNAFGQIVRGSGGMIGLRASLLRNVTKRQTIIILDNTQNESDDMALEVLKILNGQNVKPPGKSAAREFGKILVERGVDEGKIMFAKLKNDSANYALNENEFNTLGYDLMDVGKMNEALEVFKVNTELFPESWNVYDSYGEILLKVGDKADAIKMYRKSIELNPGNKNAEGVLKQLSE